MSLETLESRRLEQDLLMCFKIINGDVEIELTSFFAFSTNCITVGVTNTSCLNSQCVLMLINLVLQIECLQLGMVLQPV